MGIWDFFRKNEIERSETPLLQITVNRESLRLYERDLPADVRFCAKVEKSDAAIDFIDHEGKKRSYTLGGTTGFFHFNVRVYENFACQTDCLISESAEDPQEKFADGEIQGIRFQPFFISGAAVSNEIFRGKGVFERGLHYAGTVTSGNVTLSCLCDKCEQSFMLSSYHTGFAHSAYLYSESGLYTIFMDSSIPGSPAALSEPDPVLLAALEKRVPPAPDSTNYAYGNSLRCPHCGSPYFDFQKFPEIRKGEYYGCVIAGFEPQRYVE